MIQEYTPHQIAKVIGGNDAIEQINVWIARGDGVAVYRNENLGSANLGHEQFVSYGSAAAMLPTALLEADAPPVQLPDIGTAINWPYRLVGTYRGLRLIPHLPSPHEVSWGSPFEVCETIVKHFDGHDPKITTWGVTVQTMYHSRGVESDAKAFTVTLHLAGGIVITIRSWVYEDGVNRLAPFSWVIDDIKRGVRDGTDPNLGGALVSVYNATLPPKGD